VVFDAYRKRRAELNLPMREDRLAYSAIVYVGRTDEEGYAGAKKIMWVLTHNVASPQFRNPPGYVTSKLRAQVMRGRSVPFGRSDAKIEDLIENGIVFAGNPDTVFRQIERHYNYVGGYGNLLMLGQSGFLEHDDTVQGIRMFAREVYPRLKELKYTGEVNKALAS
jgi:hypothetical protein